MKGWRLLFWLAVAAVFGPLLLAVLGPALLAHHLNRRDARKRTPEEQHHEALRKAARQ